MAFEIGDKVKMINQLQAETRGVWGVVGVVTAIIEDGTSLERITVEFPDAKPVEGMACGQFEKA